MSENFSELEKELQKLKSELEIQDELTNRFISPVSTNYWQKRLEEEKVLFEKKLQAKEEEKKLLESRIKQQEIQLQNYQDKLTQLEKNFERELQSWQEKFRIKEADLLLEKNRILWEEKLKDAENEIRQLLEKISTLNETIRQLKDENVLEKERLLKNFDDEKKLLNEKVSLYQKTVDELTAKLSEVKTTSSDEITALRVEIEKHTDTIAKLTSEVKKLTAEKQKLESEIKNLLTSSISNEESLKKRYTEVITCVSESIKYHLSLLERVSRYRNSQKMPLGGEITYGIKGITESLNYLANQLEITDTEVKKLIISDRVKSELIEKIKKCEVVVFKEKEISKRLLKKVRPQAVVVCDIKLARKLALAHPFLPVVLVGPLKGVLKKFPVNIKITDISNAFKSAAEIENIVNDSIAIKEIWPTLLPKRKTVRYYTALFVAVFVAYGLMNFRDVFIPTERIIEYNVPYSHPTALASDTSYLWICDWQMGSIYHHKMDRALTIQRIIYFPENNFSALAFSGDALYTANPWTKKINKHLLNESLSIIKTYSTGELNISGLAFADGGLYVADLTRRAIYFGILVDATKTFEVIKTYPSPGSAPVGVWFDGKNLWSCDSGTNQIYKHRMDEDLSVENIFVLPESFQKNFKISGFTGQDNRFWLSSEKMGKIFSVPKSSLISLKKT